VQLSRSWRTMWHPRELSLLLDLHRHDVSYTKAGDTSLTDAVKAQMYEMVPSAVLLVEEGLDLGKDLRAAWTGT
jgi:hypothetical protein